MKRPDTSEKNKSGKKSADVAKNSVAKTVPANNVQTLPMELPNFGSESFWAETNQRSASHISRSQIVPGSLLVCQILEVKFGGLTLRLPSGHFGFAPKEECIENSTMVSAGGGQLTGTLPIYRRFTPGRLVVAAAIPKAGTKVRSLALTLRPSIVNAGLTIDTLEEGMWLPCTVRSVEAHGFVGSFGIADPHTGKAASMTVFVQLSDDEELPTPPSYISANSDPKNPQVSEIRRFHYYIPKIKNIVVGQIVNVCVDEINKEARIVKCSTGPSSVTKAFQEFNSPLNLKLIKAGMLVECRLTKVLEDETPKTQDVSKVEKEPPRGAVAKFCRCIEGAIPRYHMYHPLCIPADAELEGDSKLCLPKFDFREKRFARVIAVLPGTSGQGGSIQVYLSLLPHIIQWSSFKYLPDGISARTLDGLRLPKCRVTDILRGFGVRFISEFRLSEVMDPDDCDNDDEHENADLSENESPEKEENAKTAMKKFDPKMKVPIMCFAPKNLAVEDRIFKLADIFKIGKKHKARISQIHNLEGAATVTLRDGTYDSIICPSDVKVGDIVKGSIRRGNDCLHVQISEFCSGKVHVSQLTDVPMDEIHKGFKDGMNGKFRVLYTSCKNGVSLTAKKCLVEDPDPILGWKGMKPGRIASGFVQSTDHNGVWFRFFGNAKARVPLSYCKTLGKKKFKIGEVAKVKILQVSDRIAIGSLDLDKPVPSSAEEVGSDTDVSNSDVEMVTPTEVAKGASKSEEKKAKKVSVASAVGLEKKKDLSLSVKEPLTPGKSDKITHRKLKRNLETDGQTTTPSKVAKTEANTSVNDAKKLTLKKEKMDSQKKPPGGSRSAAAAMMLVKREKVANATVASGESEAVIKVRPSKKGGKKSMIEECTKLKVSESV